MIAGLAGTRQAQRLRPELSSQCGGQIRLHLLPLSLLDVILSGIFKMRLNLKTQREREREEELKSQFSER